MPVAMPPERLARRAWRFGLTGLLATGTHALVAVAAIEIARLPVTWANAIAFAVATSLSYLLNTLWSFSAPLRGRTLRRYLVVSCAGLLLAAGIAGLAQARGFGYLAGIAFVAATLPVFSFALHHAWTYR